MPKGNLPIVKNSNFGQPSYEELKKELSIAKTKAVENIDVEFIKEISNIRSDMSDDALRELSESIKDQGLLQPIIVEQHGAFFHVLVGHRRARACKLAGVKLIPAFIKEPPENLTVIQLEENILREDLSPKDLENAIVSISNNLSFNDIANKIHKSKSYISKILGAAEIRKKYSYLEKKYKTFNDLSSGILYEFTTLPENEREKAIIESLENGSSRVAIKENIEKIKDAKGIKKEKKKKKNTNAVSGPMYSIHITVDPETNIPECQYECKGEKRTEIELLIDTFFTSIKALYLGDVSQDLDGSEEA